MAEIVFDEVDKLYENGVHAVQDLSLEARDGEFLVLVGPSGCGKTTALRMVAGLEQISDGTLSIGGRVVNDLTPKERDVAMVFQNYALYPHMTVAENIAYPLRVRKVARAEADRRARAAAAMLEIEELLTCRPRELSGGERQRVALARAVVREPRAFLMDEPLSNLDAKLRLQTRGELKRLQRELATTTIYVTHDQSEAMTLAHRVAVLRSGRLQQFDTPEAIYNRPANRFVAEFVGSPAMNFIEGRYDEEARLFKSEAVTLRPPARRLEALRGRSRVALGVRPEHVFVATEARAGFVAAAVHVTELMGSETLVVLRLAGGAKVVARAPADFRAEPETPAWVGFDADRLEFFDADSGAALR